MYLVWLSFLDVGCFFYDLLFNVLDILVLNIGYLMISLEKVIRER